jgi:hypothetical protein
VIFLAVLLLQALLLKKKFNTKKNWKWLETTRLGFHMLPSKRQLTLLQNEIGILHFLFRWNNFGFSKVFQPPKR